MLHNCPVGYACIMKRRSFAFAGGGLLWAAAALAQPTAKAGAESEPASEALVLPPAAEESTAAGEVIELEQRWPGVDLIDAERTTRAAVVVRPADGRSAAALGDHLVGAAGVSIQRTGPGQAVPIVRGLIGSAVLVLVDGIRLNNAIFRPAPNQYTSLVDPWNVDSVTVVKGPGSAAFGSDALGGVVDVVSELPVFTQPGWGARSHVALGMTSADRSTVGHANLEAGKAGLGVSGAVTFEDHNDLRNGDGERSTPSAYRAWGAQLVGHWDRGHAATTAWLSLYEQPELPRTDELRAGYGQDAPAAAVWAYQPSRRVVAHARELRRGLWGLEGLELHAAYQRIDDHRRIRDTGDPIELREEIVDHGVSLLARASDTVARFELLGGVEGNHDLVACQRRELDTETGVSSPVACRFPDGSSMSQLGVFAEVRRELGPRLGLRLGLRGGGSRLDITGDSGATIDTLDWAAELGAELRLDAEISLVGNVGRGFRAPNVNDLAGLGPRPGNRYQEPSASLGNERALGVDVGARLRRPRLTTEAYLFALQHDDRIDVVPTGRMTDTGRDIVVSANVGTTTTYGAEALAALHLGQVAIDGAVSWVRGTKDDLGQGQEPADRIPPLGARAAVRWTPAPNLTLEGEVRVAAAQRRLSMRDLEDPRIDPTGTDGFATVAVGARYRWPSLAIALRVENLADAQYREHGSGIDAPGIDARLLLQWNGER